MNLTLAFPLWIWLALAGRDVPPAVAALPMAHVTESRDGRLIVDLRSVSLPAHTMHHMVLQPPVSRIEIPSGGAVYGFRVEGVDSLGRGLLKSLSRHFTVMAVAAVRVFVPISH